MYNCYKSYITMYKSYITCTSVCVYNNILYTSTLMLYVTKYNVNATGITISYDI